MNNWYEDVNGNWVNLGRVRCISCNKPATSRVVPFGKPHDVVYTCNLHREIIFPIVKTRKGD
jgi:hypothetical protein